VELGTPLSPAAVRVLLLGSGELGKEVIIALQRLGCETIAADRYENAPGHQVAHRSHVLDMTDPVAIATLVELERPHLIVPEIEAIATDELVRIEADGICQVVPTARAAQLTMNREGIRRLAAETLGLATSPYKFASSLEELRAAVDGGIGYPCVIKPTMSSSGKGQSVVRSADALAAAWDYAAKGGRVDSGRVIVEGFVDFEYEITMLTVRAKSVSGSVETHFCEPVGHVQVNGDYVESWQPQPMSALALERTKEIAHKVTEALGGRGLFGVELFVKGDMVWFSEVSPRPHDTGLVTLGTQRLSEFELHRARHFGIAGRHFAAPTWSERRDLRWHGCEGRDIFRRGRCIGGAGNRHSTVRQARSVPQAPHGRCGGDGRFCRGGPRACEDRGGIGEAESGLERMLAQRFRSVVPNNTSAAGMARILDPIS
jgi:phosphoribosylglycinamide formyltransferase 2